MFQYNNHMLKSVTRRYSLHKTSEETVDYIHDSIIYPRCVALETLEAPLEEDEAEEVRRGAGHQREGDGGHVGEGSLAGGHQVEHPPQTLTYQLRNYFIVSSLPCLPGEEGL